MPTLRDDGFGDPPLPGPRPSPGGPAGEGKPRRRGPPPRGLNLAQFQKTRLLLPAVLLRFDPYLPHPLHVVYRRPTLFVRWRWPLQRLGEQWEAD